MLEDLSTGNNEAEKIQSPHVGSAGLVFILTVFLVFVWFNLEIVIGWYYATCGTVCAGVVLVVLVAALIVVDYRRHRR